VDRPGVSGVLDALMAAQARDAFIDVSAVLEGPLLAAIAEPEDAGARRDPEEGEDDELAAHGAPH
jgi:hypothetical protein